MCARLLSTGKLLVVGQETRHLPPVPVDQFKPQPPFDKHIRRLGGGCSVIRELSWDGEITWQHEEPAVHHDVVRLANGNTLFPVWVELAADVAKRVRGGYVQRGEKLPPLLGDDIVEVDPAGQEVWRAHTWKLFDPRLDPLCPIDRRWEWTHMNSLDVNDSGDVLLSCRNNSRVAVINRASGEMTWKYGFPHTAHQHHATWVNGGNVMIFDNGMHGLGMAASRVIEVNPATNEVAWRYEGSPQQQFFSGHISGATSLPGGNVLVCEGTSGRLLEVTRRGEVAWEWWNPVYNTRPDGQSIGWLFRAYRYTPGYPGLRERELDPARWADLNRLYGLA
jgi:outer membrane protein assembly factor BamB